jgi:hypothetical protein
MHTTVLQDARRRSQVLKKPLVKLARGPFEAPTNEAGRIPGDDCIRLDIVRQDTTCADDRPVANCDALEYRRARPNPNIATYRDRLVAATRRARK